LLSFIYDNVKGEYLKMLKILKSETRDIEEARLYRSLIKNLRNDWVSDIELEMLENLYEWYRER